MPVKARHTTVELGFIQGGTQTDDIDISSCTSFLVFTAFGASTVQIEAKAPGSGVSLYVDLGSAITTTVGGEITAFAGPTPGTIRVNNTGGAPVYISIDGSREIG